MKKTIYALTPDERTALEKLAGRLKRARLRRNLLQEDVSTAAGISVGSVIALESGRVGCSIATLAKVLSVLGLLDRLPSLLIDDDLGEELEAAAGRRRARHRPGERGDAAA